jgi:hypothetical protein
MSEETIFLPSDLAGTKRLAFLQAAREGVARIRDKDGTSLVALPESQVRGLRLVAEWSGHLLRLQDLLARDGQPTVSELGDLAWLRVFDRDDLREFADELHQVLIASISDESAEALTEAIRAWRVTAKEIEDPLRRSVLTGEFSPTDLVPVERPS